MKVVFSDDVRHGTATRLPGAIERGEITRRLQGAGPPVLEAEADGGEPTVAEETLPAAEAETVDVDHVPADRADAIRRLLSLSDADFAAIATLVGTPATVAA